MGKLIIRMLIKCGITALVATVQRIATEAVNYSHGHIHTTLLGSKPGPVAICLSHRPPPAFRLTFFCPRKMSRTGSIIPSSQIRVLSRRHQTKPQLHIQAGTTWTLFQGPQLKSGQSACGFITEGTEHILTP